jgi:hypothetical protein
MSNHRRSIRRDFEKKAKIVEMRANSAKIRAILFPLIEKCASEGIIYSSSRHRTSHIFRAVKEKFMSCRKRTQFQATQNFSFNSISRLLCLCKKISICMLKKLFLYFITCAPSWNIDRLRTDAAKAASRVSRIGFNQRHYSGRFKYKSSRIRRSSGGRRRMKWKC